MNPEWEDGIIKLRTHRFINSTLPLSELFDETATENTIWALCIHSPDKQK